MRTKSSTYQLIMDEIKSVVCNGLYLEIQMTKPMIHTKAWMSCEYVMIRKEASHQRATGCVLFIVSVQIGKSIESRLVDAEELQELENLGKWGWSIGFYF